MTYHIPVLLNEVVDALELCSGATVVDCTLGGGGHSSVIATKIEGGTLVCIDKDKDAISHFSGSALEKNCEKSQVNVHLVNDDFKNLSNILDTLKINKVDAILADLGVSSHQIDNAERGFSYMNDAPLDMRMNCSQELTAYDIVNKFSENDLHKIIKDFGEERFAVRIAKAIVASRPIKTTLELSEIIKGAVPAIYYKTGGHPAKRTFQALRIAVNGELDGLDRFLSDAVNRLNSGGKIAVISFHSLEDRIVKNAFRLMSTDCICPPRIPVCVCNHKACVEVITKKPITATISETKKNPRSSSAKLRIAKKI